MATALEHTTMPWMERLELPAYTASDAARYIGVHHATIYSWHRNVGLPLRRQDISPLSYLELIELALVAAFRNLDIPINLISALRRRAALHTESDYPFVSEWFKAMGCQVVHDYDLADNPSVMSAWKSRLVTRDSNRKLVWTKSVAERFSDYDYEYEIAVRWRPAGCASSVAIDPRISFGGPTVSGVPTRILWERHKAGESLGDIADDFEIEKSAVLDALDFENAANGRAN